MLWKVLLEQKGWLDKVPLYLCVQYFASPKRIAKLETNRGSILCALQKTSKTGTHFIIQSRKPEGGELQVLMHLARRIEPTSQNKSLWFLCFFRPGEKAGNEDWCTRIWGIAKDREKRVDLRRQLRVPEEIPLPTYNLTSWSGPKHQSKQF